MTFYSRFWVINGAVCHAQASDAPIETLIMEIEGATVIDCEIAGPFHHARDLFAVVGWNDGQITLEGFEIVKQEPYNG